VVAVSTLQIVIRMADGDEQENPTFVV